MNNILDALMNIKKKNICVLPNTEYNGNKMNLQGDSLEKYIRNVFAGIDEETTTENKQNKIENTFSYIGNNNNPPDFMLRNKEAIEVKKKNSFGGSIILNSSFPKDKLYISDKKITDECRTCEEEYWKEKSMIYSIGTINERENTLESLLFIYGSLFCASSEIYENIINKMKCGIESIDGVEFSETKELGKVKNIDPLGFTDLRIRGMWNIKNPNRYLEDIEISNTDRTNICALIPLEEYEKKENKKEFEGFCNNYNINIEKVKIQNPNNLSKYIDSIKVEYEV